MTDLVKFTVDKTETLSSENLKAAFIAIAEELQRLYNSLSKTDQEQMESDFLIDKYIVCKSTVKSKKHQIKLLERNLNIACTIAKTVLNAKGTVAASLNEHLKIARQESSDLLRTAKENLETIHRLDVEKRNLESQLSNFNNIIALGYKELQNICAEEFVEKVPMKQLQKIIIYCGQYYANYCNERELRTQLEQKNRFLRNKLRILESNLESANKELIHTQQQNLQLKNNRTFDGKKNKISRCATIESSSENQLYQRSKKIAVSPTVKNEKLRKLHCYSDLPAHYSLVQKLLDEQNVMIKDLKSLTSEINE